MTDCQGPHDHVDTMDRAGRTERHCVPARTDCEHVVRTAAGGIAVACWQDPPCVGHVTLTLPAGELDFLLRFDPDRDRSASRADMVAVLEHFQAVLREALPGGTP